MPSPDAGQDGARRRTWMWGPVLIPLVILVWWLSGVLAPLDAASPDGSADLELASTLELPIADGRAMIVVDADQASHWQEGAYRVWHLRGAVRVTQDHVNADAEEAILWIDETEGPSRKMLAFLEGNSERRVRVAFGARSAGERGQAIEDATWLGRFHTDVGVEVRARQSYQPIDHRRAYQRAMQARDAERRAFATRAQFTSDSPPLDSQPFEPVPPTREPFGSGPLLDPNAPPPSTPFPGASGPSAFDRAPATEFGAAASGGPGPLGGPGGSPNSGSGRHLTITGRSSVRPEVKVLTDPVRNETVFVFTGGIRAVIEGLESELGGARQIVIDTDNLVAWSPKLSELSQMRDSFRTGEAPFELYMEGNLVFTEGDRVIYAERMYYNVAMRSGVVLDAEILTPVPNYEGLLRLKADVLQQLDRQNFRAFGGAVTSSRLGVPRYWLQSQDVRLTDIPHPVVDPYTGQPVIDPRSGEPTVEHELRTTGHNNFVYLGGVPVLYWPVFATDLRRPTPYIDSIRFGNDQVFGTQVRVDWDIYQLLGIRNAPAGTDWTLSTDYLSARGPALGTTYRYQRNDLFGLSGPARGIFDAWGIRDRGFDNLGRDRRHVAPEHEFRGRLFGQHRQNLPDGYQVTGELGLLSDRNFLEQYFEREFDQLKDQTTGAEFKRIFGDSSLGIAADVRLNDFFTQTEWLPRADHFLLGRSVLGDRLTWFAHSHVGYARLRTAALPLPGSQPPQSSLPWETDFLGNRYGDRTGIRAATRQELDFPIDWGPFRFVPYVLGEAAYWQEDRNGEQVTRLYGQAGARGSLSMWRVEPNIQSTLLNVNGLAHKVTFDADFFYADANKELERFPLYDPLTDDGNEMFERMFIHDRHGGLLPTKFDSRSFALRSALQGEVTGPTEIADDLIVGRLGLRQRLQTKRGLPGQERVVDWVVLDVQASVFPKAARDNFNTEAGLIDYNFRWHVGDRLTLVSDGFVDVFGDGLRKYTVGAFMSRPEVGNIFVGYRAIDGPFNSSVLIASLSYRMSEKWIVTAGSAIDLAQAGNIGQTVAFTRIGESFLVKAGFNADVSRGNVGAMVSVEPRFLPRGLLGQAGGVRVAPAGVYGLE